MLASFTEASNLLVTALTIANNASVSIPPMSVRKISRDVSNVVATWVDEPRRTC